MRSLSKKRITSEATKKKQSIAATGRKGYWAGKKRPRSVEWQARINKAHKGLKHSEKTKAKMRANMLGIKNPMFGVTGLDHPNYIKDRNQLKTDRLKAYDTKYKNWMNKVKNRDGRKCVINNKDCRGRLEAHHILPWSEFPKLRYNINNGISLCQYHHPRKSKDVTKLAPIFTEIVLATA